MLPDYVTINQIVTNLVLNSKIGGWEDYGDLKGKELIDYIIKNIYHVETGITQQMPSTEIIPTVKKAISKRQGGYLVDLCKELYKNQPRILPSVFDTINKELGLIDAEQGTSGILDIGIPTLHIQYTNPENASKGFESRLLKMVSTEPDTKFFRHEKEIFGILKAWPEYQAKIIAKAFSQSFLESLLSIPNLRERADVLQQGIRKLSDEAKLKAMHTAMKKVHEQANIPKLEIKVNSSETREFTLPDGTVIKISGPKHHPLLDQLAVVIATSASSEQN